MNKSAELLLIVLYLSTEENISSFSSSEFLLKSMIAVNTFNSNGLSNVFYLNLAIEEDLLLIEDFDNISSSPFGVGVTNPFVFDVVPEGRYIMEYGPLLLIIDIGVSRSRSSGVEMFKLRDSSSKSPNLWV